LEPRKNEKKSFPHPQKKNLKGIKARHLECMLGPSHWLHEIFLPKRVHHHFWLGLIPSTKNTLPIQSSKPCKTLFINTPLIWKMYKGIKKKGRI
jgi:hypothetical protein